MGHVDEDVEKNPIVYMDITIDEEKVGRIVFELFKNVVPKTAENFRALCTGEKGVGTNNKNLHYKGSVFHKAVPACMIQGGDIINNDGTGGESIYGPIFEDENFELRHDSPGLLTMANHGSRNTNSSQFCITTVPCPHLDKAHVVFGRVIKGFDIVTEISYVPVTAGEKPIQVCKVADCGELKKDDNWGINESDGADEPYPPYPSDWDKTEDDVDIDQILAVANEIKSTGNHLFKKGDLVDANHKYKKAVRYISWYQKHLKQTEIANRTLSEVERLCQLNSALVKLKQKQYKEAISLCNTVLSADMDNPKALYRRGQANVALSNLELAQEDFQRASKFLPNDQSILTELKSVQTKLAKYKKMERASYARMFSGGSGSNQ